MIVLLAETHGGIASVVADRLRGDGHCVSRITADARWLIGVASDTYDLIVLDVDSPSAACLDSMTASRRRGLATPIVVLTTIGDLDDRIAIMDRGADDCLAKPFDVRELQARMRALTRRLSPVPASKAAYGDVSVDIAARTVIARGNPVEFNRREFRLFELLVLRFGQVVPKQRLMDQLFGYEDDVGPNALELYISRIRRKLDKSSLRIDTIRRVGYLVRLQDRSPA